MGHLIKLYYVRGINRTDTPYFTTKIQQDNFFEDKRCNTIPDSFYPPHYRNTIDLAIGDIFISAESSQINYLSLEYLDSTYYYFIDKFTYINEDIVRLDITMDVIQTYMFDIRFHNARVSRETIKRWNGNLINREYIRENYSNEIMINKVYKDYTEDKNETGIIIAKTKHEHGFFGTNIPSFINTTNDNNSRNNLYSDGSMLLGILFPIEYINGFDSKISLVTLQKIDYDTGNNIGTGLPISYSTIVNCISNLGEGKIKFGSTSETVTISEMYYIPFIPFFDIKYNNNTLTYKIPYKEDTTLFNKGYDVYVDTGTPNELMAYIIIYSGKVSDYFDFYTLPFTKNDTLGTLFNYKYVPQLIDENYVQLEFGERIQRASYPMSKLTHNMCYLFRSADVFTGARNYTIKNSVTEYDKYFVKLTIDSKELCIMWNDQWKNYYTGHQGSLAINTSIAMGQIASDTYANSKYFKRPIRKGKLTQRARKGLQNISESEGFETIKDETINYINLIKTPDTQIQGNNYTNDVISSALHTVLVYNECSNIQLIATIYESIGYAVDKYVIGNPLKQNRQIYNYIECDEIDISLNNRVNDEETLSQIEERYQDGIRFWNMDVIANNNLNIEMGDVCVYDNLEKED